LFGIIALARSGRGCASIRSLCGIKSAPVLRARSHFTRPPLA
jgi:hypothetical protein